MARKALLVLAAGVAAAGIVATGAVAGAALTDGGPDDGFGVAVSTSSPGDRSSSGDPSSSGGAAVPSDDSTPSEAPTSKAPAGEAVSRDRAIEVALAKTGGGAVVDTEREWEHGRPAWKIEVVKGGVEHDVYVDRETGGIVKYDRDDDGRSDDDRDGDSGPSDDRDDDSGRGAGKGGTR